MSRREVAVKVMGQIQTSCSNGLALVAHYTESKGKSYSGLHHKNAQDLEEFDIFMLIEAAKFSHTHKKKSSHQVLLIKKIISTD